MQHVQPFTEICALGAHHLDGEGVDSGFEFCIERRHDGAMLGETGHAGELGGRDADAEMGLTTLAITAVPSMFLALVDHFKVAWREFDRKFFCNLIANGHMHTGSVWGGRRTRN